MKKKAATATATSHWAKGEEPGTAWRGLCSVKSMERFVHQPPEWAMAVHIRYSCGGGGSICLGDPGLVVDFLHPRAFKNLHGGWHSNLREQSSLRTAPEVQRPLDLGEHKRN